MDAMVMETAVRTRMRHLSISGEDALDPRNGYVLGRLFKGGHISSGQHEIGLRYANDMAWYYQTTGVKPPVAKAQNFMSSGPDDGEDSLTKAESAARARKRMIALQRGLLAVGDINTGRKVHNLMMSVIVEDRPMKINPPNLALLVRGLNAVGKIYGAS